MAASLSIPPRSYRKSIAGASNPAVMDSCCAAPQSVEFTNKKAAPNKVAARRSEVDARSQGRDHSSSTETAASKQVVPHLVAPSTPTSSIILPDRSLSSRPSLDSTKSSSTTDSSIKSNRLFDTPVCSPRWDSPQTSPEQADLIENKAIPFDGQPRNKHRTTNDKSQEAYETESPARAAGKRKKASSKDRVTPPLQKEASPSSHRLKPPVIERPRSSSAPGVPPPTKFRSSSIDPISLDIERYLIPGIASLTLKDKHDETRSPRTARAASASTGLLAGEYMGRPSSASGRVEKRLTTEAKEATMGSGLDSQSGDSTDWEASSRIQWPKPVKDSQLNTPAPPSTATIEERDGAKIVPKDSSISSSSVHTTAMKIASRRSGTPLPMQQETIENAIPETIHHTPEKSSPRVIRPVDGPGDHLGSPSAHKSLENAGSTAGDVPEAGSVPEADTVPDLDAAPAADEELQYSVFERFHDDVYHQTDIRAELMDIISPKPTKRRASTKLKRGYIHVYSFPLCIHAAEAGTEQKYKHFKIGFTLGTPPKRRSQQKKCRLTVSPIKDKKQRLSKCAGIFDDLIKRDLREYRGKFQRKVPTHIKTDGSRSEHRGWYECGLQRVLDCTEKWRGWVTKCDLFDSEGLLKSHQVWKPTTLDQDKDRVDLDSSIQPFTLGEDLLYRKYWFIEQCWDLCAQGKGLSTVIKILLLLVFLSFVGLSLFHTLGLQPGSVYSALLVKLAAYIGSGR